MAAFSISGYAWASWRYRYKPFNPVLGETYESHREDRGFHYVSEQVTSRNMLTKASTCELRTCCNSVCYMFCFQVSHHPPISACHAESENFTFWQGSSHVHRDECWIHLCLISGDKPHALFVSVCSQIRDGKTSFGGSLWRYSLLGSSTSACPSEPPLHLTPVTLHVQHYFRTTENSVLC